MKCEHCGNNLQIENAFCPYCGQPNPFAVRHQREMQHFTREFQKTRQDVLEQSSRFSRRTIWVTILAILIAACAFMAFLCAKADDIRYSRIEKRIEAEAQEHSKVIDAFMAERDFAGLYSYMDRNHLSYTRAFDEYDAVYRVSLYYTRLYENLMILLSKSVNENVYTYYKQEELIEDIAAGIEAIGEAQEENEYHPEQYTEDKKEYMKAAEETAAQLLIRYMHITEEEAEQLPSMTQARRAVLLEDAYERQS